MVTHPPLKITEGLLINSLPGSQLPEMWSIQGLDMGADARQAI